MITSEPNSPTALANASATPERIPGQDVREDDPAERRHARTRRASGPPPPSPRRARAGPAAPSGRRTAASRTSARARSPCACTRRRCRSATSARRARAASRPATIVGSANGRSMIAFTTDLPRKSSRTSTQAVIVPSTALSSDDEQRRAERQLQRGDRLRARDRVPEPARARPSSTPRSARRSAARRRPRGRS